MSNERHLIDFVCLCNLSIRAIEKTFQLSLTVSQPNNRKCILKDGTLIADINDLQKNFSPAKNNNS